MSDQVVNLRDFRVTEARRTISYPKPAHRYDLPADVVRIDRRSPWGNPFKIGDPDPAWCGESVRLSPRGLELGPLGRDGAIAHFRFYAVDRLTREPDWLEPLHGKRLACWCAPLACHGDVIVELLGAAMP